MKRKLTSPLQRLIQITFLFSSMILLTQCNKDGENETTTLNGRFVNETFLKQVSDSIPGLVPVYCYELNFDGTDSVNILYGFEQAKLAYKKNGEKYQIIQALKDKDMIFTLTKDSTLNLIDSAWNGANQNSTFKQVKNSTDFISSLNKKMIAGEYELFKGDKSTQIKVNLKEDGSVSGLEKFTSYTLCYSGDCVGEIYPISNSITFSNEQKETVLYAFKVDKTRNRLNIYHVEAPVKDIKGERAVKELAFDLRK